MKQFFYIVFGGLGAVVCGIIIFFAGKWMIQSAGIFLADLKVPIVQTFSNVASAVIAKPDDGTEISGFSRIVRYTASEEEDLMMAATLSLPTGSIKDVSAKAYLVENLSKDTTVVQSNANNLLPIASLTKLVTAIVAKKQIKPDQRIVISKEVVDIYGNTAQFKTGETFKAGDLLYPLLMVSSNDAAEALARSYGRAKFIAAMNDFVQSIGAYRTSFADPSGLSPDNRSTAKDLAIILNWIKNNNPEILDITELKTKTIRAHTWVNPTHFLSWSNYIGGKNGYTDEANRTAAALFKMGKDKDVFAVVVLGSSSRDQDIIKLLSKIKN